MIRVHVIDALTGKGSRVDKDHAFKITGIVGSQPIDIPELIGWETVRFNGFNAAIVGSGIIADDSTDPYEGFITTPVLTEIVSSSVADAGGGTGLERVSLVGLDAGFRRVVFDVDIDGTTPVVIPITPVLRGLLMRGLKVGSNESNVGTITWREVGGAGITFAQILPGRGANLAAIATVPKEPIKAYLTSWRAGISRSVGATNTVAEVELIVRRPGFSRVVEAIMTLSVFGNTEVTRLLNPWLEVPLGADVWVNVASTSSTAAFEGGFAGVLIPEGTELGP